MPSTLLRRDVDLDRSLESDSRVTLVTIGAGIAILLLVAFILLFKQPIHQYLRQKMGLTSQDLNTDTDTTFGSDKVPSTDSTPSKNMSSYPTEAPLGRDQVAATKQQRRQGFFNPVRKYASTPRYSNIQVYRGAHGLHTPPPAKLLSARRPPTMPALSVQAYAAAHNAAWMELADTVVGRHPHAQPLSSRVATKAEIEMISGHVHIPWAYSADGRPQPMPVKVMKPAVIYPPIVTQPGLLKDIGNISGRDVRVASKPPGGKGPSKGKQVLRARGKENMGATLTVPNSSLRPLRARA